MKLNALGLQKQGRISGSRWSTFEGMGMHQTSYTIGTFNELTITKKQTVCQYNCQLFFRTSDNPWHRKIFLTQHLTDFQSAYYLTFPYYFLEVLTIPYIENHFKAELTWFSINHFLEEVWKHNSILVSLCQYHVVGWAEELQPSCIKPELVRSQCDDMQ